MRSLLRSNPHKEHLVTELQIRVVTGIDASMKWNELCKLMKEHEKHKGVASPQCQISSRSSVRISCCSTKIRRLLRTVKDAAEEAGESQRKTREFKEMKFTIVLKEISVQLGLVRLFSCGDSFDPPRHGLSEKSTGSPKQQLKKCHDGVRSLYGFDFYRGPGRCGTCVS
jgi:hypothetical protein